MMILEVKNRTPEFIQQLLVVWEESVIATHLFLSNSEIENIKKYIPQKLNSVANLIIVKNDKNFPIGFMGIEDGYVEMLFITPEERGKGLGKSLIQRGMVNYNIH